MNHLLAPLFDLTGCIVRIMGTIVDITAQKQVEITGEFDRTGMPCEKICFEITETAAISNFVIAGNLMRTLRGSQLPVLAR
jgi:EAL domain-containing protein (putative c-di-GMP-specific phosphodiesterase class I)